MSSFPYLRGGRSLSSPPQSLRLPRDDFSVTRSSSLSAFESQTHSAFPSFAPGGIQVYSCRIDNLLRLLCPNSPVLRDLLSALFAPLAIIPFLTFNSVRFISRTLRDLSARLHLFIVNGSTLPSSFKRHAIGAPLDRSVYCSFTFDISEDSSSYARLFPGLSLNCYRDLIMWVLPYSHDASNLLDILLPINGPVVAVDLGLLLSSVVVQFDLKNMILPNLSENTIHGVAFLHFDVSKSGQVLDIIVRLLTFDGYVGAKLDPTSMINIASSVGAATIAAGEASMQFRSSLGAMPKVELVLTDEDEYWIVKEVGPINFTNSRPLAHDHKYLAACRELVRCNLKNLMDLSSTTRRTLVLGAASREFKSYRNNFNVTFQIAGVDAKDTERVLWDSLGSLRKAKNNKAYRRSVSEATRNAQFIELKTVEEALLEWKKANVTPDRIMLWEESQKLFNSCDGTNVFDQLVFEDVGYNFTANDWGRIFRSTGASSAIGYLMLPWQLLQPDMIAPYGYTYRIEGDMSYVAFGYSNGYAHKTKAWSTLMSNVSFDFGDFNICVEFINRVGPMTLVRLSKNTSNEKLTRRLALPDHLQSIRILDVAKSFDPIHRELRPKLVYMPIKHDEFAEALVYALDMAKESMTYGNILLYIRRKKSGMSLLNKSTFSTWRVATRQIPNFAMVVYLSVVFLTKDFADFQNLIKGSTMSAFMALLKRKAAWVKLYIRPIYDFFMTRKFFDKLTLDVKDEFWQTSKQRLLNNIRKRSMLVNTGPGPEAPGGDPFNMTQFEDEGELDFCAFCHDLKDVCGDQLFTCERDKPEETTHDFLMSNEMVTKFRNLLKDTENDPPGLKAIKETALTHTPMTGFSNSLTVRYICGPPGTGKSYIIRSLAKMEDLVLGPYARLRNDYTNFVHPISKKVTSLPFVTMHQGFSMQNRVRIFVDEYTAMPYECLAIIALNCGAEEIILVGDHKQPGIINEVEGISIESQIDISGIRAHQLIKNFRNPRDVINILNGRYGYKTVAVKNFDGFKFDNAKNYQQYPEHTPLFFKHTTAVLFGVESSSINKVTVRANQGATYEKVKLVVIGADQQLFNTSSLAIVALSRHTHQCVILSQDNSTTAAFKGSIEAAAKTKLRRLPINISPVFTRAEILDRLEEGDDDMPALEFIEDNDPSVPSRPAPVIDETIPTGITSINNDEEEDDDEEEGRHKTSDTRGPHDEHPRDDSSSDDDDPSGGGAVGMSNPVGAFFGHTEEHHTDQGDQGNDVTRQSGGSGGTGSHGFMTTIKSKFFSQFGFYGRSSRHPDVDTDPACAPRAPNIETYNASVHDLSLISDDDIFEDALDISFDTNEADMDLHDEFDNFLSVRVSSPVKTSPDRTLLSTVDLTSRISTPRTTTPPRVLFPINAGILGSGPSPVKIDTPQPDNVMTSVPQTTIPDVSGVVLSSQVTDPDTNVPLLPMTDDDGLTPSTGVSDNTLCSEGTSTDLQFPGQIDLRDLHANPLFFNDSSESTVNQSPDTSDNNAIVIADVNPISRIKDIVEISTDVTTSTSQTTIPDTSNIILLSQVSDLNMDIPPLHTISRDQLTPSTGMSGDTLGSECIDTGLQFPGPIDLRGLHSNPLFFNDSSESSVNQSPDVNDNNVVLIADLNPISRVRDIVEIITDDDDNVLRGSDSYDIGGTSHDNVDQSITIVTDPPATDSVVDPSPNIYDDTEVDESLMLMIDFMNDLSIPPVDNNCLLSSLADLLDVSLSKVWMSMCAAIGIKTAKIMYGKPLSTKELKMFCYFNNLSILVESNTRVINCGVFGIYHGVLKHDDSNGGHFSVSLRVVPRGVTLRSDFVVDVDGRVISDIRRAWDDTFTRVSNMVKDISRDRAIREINEIQSSMTCNPIAVNLFELIGKDVEMIKVMRIPELVSLINIFQSELNLLNKVLILSRLHKNNSTWLKLRDAIVESQLNDVELVGGSATQVKSFPVLKTLSLQNAPPEPYGPDDKAFVDMARLFIDPVPFDKLLVEIEEVIKYERIRIEPSPYDAFKLLVNDFGTMDEDRLVITNQETLNYLDDKFANGTFDLTTLDQTNPRGHPKRTEEKAWCLLNVAPGVTYFRNNLAQSLHCLQARYLTKAYNVLFSNESVEKAREIADLFYFEHMNENYDVFNEQDIFKTVNESEHAMKIKNYHKQAMFEPEIDEDVRFSMKDIFKPLKGKIDLFKAGQGISAWSRDMQTIFQSSFRIINKHFINSLKPHVIYDNGIDEEELMLKINCLFRQLPTAAVNGVIDATACDSGQNRFTQLIERFILERLGINSEFLDWYYNHRSKYLLKGYGVVAVVKDIKTSGEPATLLNNTILMAALMNYILRGEGPCVLVIKGDDGLKRQANMKHRLNMVADLRRYLKMEFKVDIDVPMTFCGYFLSDSCLIPDVVRKAIKIVGHRFRDYSHFAEYQQSLRDWIRVVNFLDLVGVCYITADSYDLTADYVMALFFSIVSLSHINERQFTSNFTLRVLDYKEEYVATKPWSERMPWCKSDN